MFCAYCGTQLPETARFCSNCGQEVLPGNGSQPAVSAPQPDAQAAPAAAAADPRPLGQVPSQTGTETGMPPSVFENGEGNLCWTLVEDFEKTELDDEGFESWTQIVHEFADDRLNVYRSDLMKTDGRIEVVPTAKDLVFGALDLAFDFAGLLAGKHGGADAMGAIDIALGIAGKKKPDESWKYRDVQTIKLDKASGTIRFECGGKSGEASTTPEQFDYICDQLRQKCPQAVIES